MENEKLNKRVTIGEDMLEDISGGIIDVGQNATCGSCKNFFTDTSL